MECLCSLSFSHKTPIQLPAMVVVRVLEFIIGLWTRFTAILTPFILEIRSRIALWCRWRSENFKYGVHGSQSEIFEPFLVYQNSAGSRIQCRGTDASCMSVLISTVMLRVYPLVYDLKPKRLLMTNCLEYSSMVVIYETYYELY